MAEVYDFKILADRVREALNEIEEIRTARRHVELERNRVQAIRIVPRDGYPATEARDVTLANALKDELVKTTVREAELERDRRLLEIAARLEAIRAVICSEAAKGAIALGCMARSLVQEVANSVHSEVSGS